MQKPGFSGFRLSAPFDATAKRSCLQTASPPLQSLPPYKSSLFTVYSILFTVKTQDYFNKSFLFTAYQLESEKRFVYTARISLL